jgi:hypothetical protein
MSTGEKIDNLLGLIIKEDQAGPPDLLGKENRQRIREMPEIPEQAPFTKQGRYVPGDPAHPWRDFYVQTCARQYLKQVIERNWIRNHPHPNCNNMYVDEWGRMFCKYIAGTQIGVEGPWENPTHYLFYAYNLTPDGQYSTIRLNDFLRQSCNIEIA